MQSAVLQIKNIENSNYCTDGAILFDIGSQRSFLTELTKNLKLLTLRKVTMIFQVFRQHDNKVKDVDILKIKIKGNDGLWIFIEAVSCSKICPPMRYQMCHFAKNSYDHLTNINLLQHSEEGSTSIDFLIGNYFCYSFINGSIVPGQKDKPIAIETYLGGFILSDGFIDEDGNKES